MSKSIPRPLPQCAHPDCSKTLSTHKATYCREHFKYSPQFLENTKRRANTPEGRERMSKAAKAQGGKVWLGRKHSEESKAIIKEKRAQQVFSKESIKKRADALRGRPSWNKGIPKTDDARAKTSKTLRSKRDHLSQKAKERYTNETEEQRDRRLVNWIKAGQDSIPKMLGGTSIELFIAQQLDLLGVEYRTQERIGYYVVDIYIPSNNLIINVDGCFWHGCEKCGFNSPQHIAKRSTDRKRYFYLTSKGYIVKALWEHSIRKAMADSTYDLHLSEWLDIL